MAVESLKRKHRVRKPTQDGYRRPADNGDQGTKHLRHHKASDKERALIYQQQRRRVMVLIDGRRVRMRDA
jgi:hypothetical protein